MVQEIKKHDGWDEDTFKFSLKVIFYANALVKSKSNLQAGQELFKSAACIGANYLDAIELFAASNLKVTKSKGLNSYREKRVFIKKIKTCHHQAQAACDWLKSTQPEIPQKKYKTILLKDARKLAVLFANILENNNENRYVLRKENIKKRIP